MKKTVLFLAFLTPLYLFNPSTSSALDFFGASRTYLQARRTASSADWLPFFEYLDLNAEGIGSKELSFYFGGWGKVDLRDESYNGRTEGNIQYAYLSYRRPTANTTFNLGRFYVFEGVMAEQVDGFGVKTNLAGGLGISLFGGLPAETDSENRTGEYTYGGRISQGKPGLYTLGLSYVQEDKNEANLRQEMGFDLWLRPWNWMEIQGKSGYEFGTSGWREHDYLVLLRPMERLILRASTLWVDYKNYFYTTTMNAFRSPSLDPEEKVFALKGAADFLINSLTLSADYQNNDYKLSGNARYYGGKISYSNLIWGGGGLSFHRMDGETDKLRYSEFRAYGHTKLGKADMTLDFLYVYYDAAINGVKNAYSVVGAAGYNFTEKIRLAADLEYSQNPDFDQDLRAMVKFVYQFTTSLGKKEEKQGK